VLLEPFVLPHQDDFSTPEAFRNSSGPANWNQQQGFYIYRSGRMIQSGGWSNLRTPDEHTKLARISVSFTPELDEAFKINVAKMRVQMPGIIREQIKQAIGPVLKIAQDSYRKRGASGPTPTTPPPSGQSTSQPPPPITQQPQFQLDHPQIPSSPIVDPEVIQEPRLTLKQWSDLLLSASNAFERPIVRSVLKRLTKAND
jgi:hypothetical protein